VPLVPEVISRLCGTVPTEMRHSGDIVQACPGGGPVIPNQSLAVQRLEREIRTQEFRFSLLLFLFFLLLFNECLIQNCFFLLPLVPPARLTPAFILFHPSLTSYYIDHFCLVFARFRVTGTCLGTNALDKTPPTCASGKKKNTSLCTLSPALLRDATYHK